MKITQHLKSTILQNKRKILKMSSLRIDLKVDLLVQSREGLFRLDLIKSAKEVVESEKPHILH